MRIQRLNHATLFVRDLKRSIAFYRDVLDMTQVAKMDPHMVFLRASGSNNHHDLGLAEVPAAAPLPSGARIGLSHVAWEVETIDDVAEAKEALMQAGAFSRATDHSHSKSVYGRDPDGNAFEITWMVPRAQWKPDADRTASSRPMDLDHEVAIFSARQTPK